MKLALLTTSFPRSEDDIAGRFVRDFGVSLARRGHRVTVLAAEDAEVEHEAPPELVVRTVAYARPRALERTFYGSGAPENLARDVRACLGVLTFPPALLVRAAALPSDVEGFVSHWALPCALAAGAVRSDRPHVAVMHSADVHVLARLPGRALVARAIEASATALWFVSDALRESYEDSLGRAPRRPVVVRPMGPELDGAKLRPAVARRAGPVVLVMGRLEPIKGVDGLVRAMAAVPEATLVVAGEGSERPKLEALASALGVRANFVGTLRGKEKARRLAEADVFVACSRELGGRSEGAPVGVVEAMTYGKALVVTRTGGIPELVGDAGVIVPPDDVVALKGAIRRLLDDRYLRERLGREAEQRAAMHAWPDIASTAESLLASTAH